MTNFTDLEMNVLNQLIEYTHEFNEECTDVEGNPIPHVDNYIYANWLKGDQKQIRGVLSSLIKKDAIKGLESTDEHDRFAWIFAINYKTWKQITEAA